MILEGDNRVIDALKEKKRLMEAKQEHGHIRPLLMVGAGLMKGVYGAGAMVALEELGYRQVFSSAVGLSSGAPTLAYFLAGQAAVLPGLIAEDVASTKLIRPLHLRNVVNLEYFVDILRGATGRGLNFPALLRTPTDFKVAVSAYKTARPVFFTPGSENVFMDCMRATVAIPGIVTQKVKIDGARYVDGASTQPYALDAAYQTIDATHVLAIMNQDRDASHSPRMEKFISATLVRHRFSPALLEASTLRHAARNQFAQQAIAGPIPTTVVWGDARVGSYEREATYLYEVTEASRVWWRELLST